MGLKAVDLALQTTALIRMLGSGFPTPLVYSYAVLIAANAIKSAVIILMGNKHSAFTEVLVDST